MFISYEYKEYLGYDDKTKQYKYRYKIIDSDFEDKADVSTGWVEAAREEALIEVYEKRNLPVAANLALLFQYEHIKGEKISDLIKWNKEHNKKYLKYADEVDKLMLWI